MPVYVAAVDVEPRWEPLELLARVLADHRDLPSIDPDDFMYMWRLEARSRADLHLYKHIDTRCYLNLDDAGHAYWFVGPGRPRADKRLTSVYRPHRNLRDAIDLLDLWLLQPDAPLQRRDE